VRRVYIPRMLKRERISEHKIESQSPSTVSSDIKHSEVKVFSSLNACTDSFSFCTWEITLYNKTWGQQTNTMPAFYPEIERKCRQQYIRCCQTLLYTIPTIDSGVVTQIFIFQSVPVLKAKRELGLTS